MVELITNTLRICTIIVCCVVLTFVLVMSPGVRDLLLTLPARAKMEDARASV